MIYEVGPVEIGQNWNQNPLTWQVSCKGPVKFRLSQRYIISDCSCDLAMQPLQMFLKFRSPLQETCYMARSSDFAMEVASSKSALSAV